MVFPDDAPDLLTLRAAGEEGVALAGGKAASLAALRREGFPVPEAVVVTTAAFVRALEAGGKRQELGSLLRDLDPEDREELAARALHLQELVRDLPLPEGLEEELHRAAERLDRGAGLAVRSSATCEDLPGASFAGQHDSFLGVPSSGIPGAVRRVWASLYSPRALAYRLSMGFLAGGTLPAVIVQRQVDPEISGVLFTADPMTGCRDQLFLSACPGLGEGVVGGGVDPDEYRLERDSCEVLSLRVGSKETRLELAPEGGTREAPGAPHAGESPCLPERVVRELAIRALEVESAFGEPQDIEWCLEDGAVRLLQSRPVTTRIPRPEDEGQAGYADVYVYAHGNFAETMPDPPTPYGWTVMEALTQRVFNVMDLDFPDLKGYRLIRLIHGRPYWDLTPVFRSEGLRRRLGISWRLTDHFTGEALDRVAVEHPPRVRPLISAWGWLWILLQLPLRLPGLLWVMARILWDAERVVAEANESLERALDSLKAARPGTPGAEAWVAQLRRIHATTNGSFLGPPRYVFLGMGACIGFLVRVVDLWLEGEPGTSELLEMAAGPKGNMTLRAGEELWGLARRLRDDEAVRAVLLAGEAGDVLERLADELPEHPVNRWLAEYLDSWGHRGPGEQDLANPRWYEDPTPVIETIRAYLAMGDAGATPLARRARTLERRGRLAAEVERTLRERAWFPALPLRARLFRAVLDRAHQLMPIREDAKHYALRFFRELKLALLAAGEDLHARGLLRRPDDVFYFEVGELEGWVEAGTPSPDHTRARVLRRRLARRRAERVDPPLVILSSGVTYHEPHEETGEVLRGDGASPGVARGVVRILEDPREATRLGPGDVLVTRFTDPAWTPLFLVAGALVMEVGGIASHGATVAREYGIPAVVGAREATTRLVDGQRVIVDGNRGVVRPEEEA